jgi:uncharacterized phage-like protein YoqJ
VIICGTGHRPDKLGGYGKEVTKALISVAIPALWELTKEHTHESIISTVISGGALGWDQALAHAALEKQYTLHMYLPFKDFDSKWPEASRKELEYLCISAKDYSWEDPVKYICEPGYAPWKMQKRNEAMVDAADVVLAMWNGSSGGTGNCIKYAKKVGKPIVNLWDKYEEARRA